eukprot:4252416-Pyramimonas_sp.AAC.1
MVFTIAVSTIAYGWALRQANFVALCSAVTSCARLCWSVQRNAVMGWPVPGSPSSSLPPAYSVGCAWPLLGRAAMRCVATDRNSANRDG